MPNRLKALSKDLAKTQKGKELIQILSATPKYKITITQKLKISFQRLHPQNQCFQSLFCRLFP